MPATERVHVGLRRRLTLPSLTFYGLGTIVGPGIYVLVGAIAGRAGVHASVAFLTAALDVTIVEIERGLRCQPTVER